MVRSLSEEAAKSKASPTGFHRMLARLGKENRLKRLYTQNIDGIETSMTPLKTDVPLNTKGPWPATIQLHGSLDIVVCQKCRSLFDFDRELFKCAEPPECPQCAERNEAREAAGHRSHGIGKLRPRIVLYNEHNPDEEAITSVMNADIRSRPDALIVAGTSLKIPGVRRLVKVLCNVVRSRRNGVTMWINNEPPVGKEFEDCWDLMVKGSCDQVAQIANLKEWDDDSTAVHQLCTDAEVKHLTQQQLCSVVIPKTPKKKQKTQTGLCTPSSSHDEDPSGLSHKPSYNAACPNPASRGPSINDVLNPKASKPKANPKPRSKNSAPKKKGKKDTSAENTKITTFSQVTKSAKRPVGEKTSEDSTKAMDSIPHIGARDNVKFSKLGDEKTGTKASRSPRGMENLMHHPPA